MKKLSAPYLDGWHTHRKFGNPMPENPYSEDKQAYSHEQWIRGWCDRFTAIKQSGSLEHDE